MLGVVAVLAGGFAYLNANELTAVHIGFTTLYQVPLVGLVFMVFLLGMATMFLMGIRHDLRVRRILRAHGIDPAEEPGAPPDPEPGETPGPFRVPDPEEAPSRSQPIPPDQMS